ncbi:MAG: ClpXP protease specificity-enhancing factor, partial [Wohlfahrtiimonas sp.]
MMTSNKPYIIRAFYEWILDNNVTPYIAVDATLPYVEVPEQYVSEGKIILNLLPSAIHNLSLGNEWISFSTRFNGVSVDINAPIGAVVAIYARENGHGIEFPPEPLTEDPFVQEDDIKTSKKETSPFSVVSNETKSSKKIDEKKSEPKKTTTKKTSTKKPSLTI